MSRKKYGSGSKLKNTDPDPTQMNLDHDPTRETNLSPTQKNPETDPDKVTITFSAYRDDLLSFEFE